MLVKVRFSAAWRVIRRADMSVWVSFGKIAYDSENKAFGPLLYKNVHFPCQYLAVTIFMQLNEGKKTY